MPEAVSETKLLGASCRRRPTRRVAEPLAMEARHWRGTLASARIGPRFQDRFVSEFAVFDSLPLGMIPQFRQLACVALISAVILASCGSATRADERPLFGTGVFHPPPKPGASISQTRMCECQACEPSNCCDGPDEDAPPKTCADSYDFSNPGCGGLSVQSCASRCAREVWRVRSGEACAAKRSASCCQAG